MSQKQMLMINLTTKAIQAQPLSDALLRGYLGGRGLGAKLLFDLLKPCTPALSEENPLIFTVGTWTGSGFPAGTQWSVTAKSPLTGGYGGAFCWGEFGVRLSHSGYAAIVLTGAAAEPVYLHIAKSGVFIRSAQSLWGKDTRETADLLEQMHEPCSTAVIGRAGETCSGLACILGDRHQMLLRTGMGAVMGSKKLKAIVVEDLPTENIYSSDFRRVSEELVEQVRTYPASVRLREQGKPMLIRSKNQVGDLATRNHQQCSFDEAIDDIDGLAVRKLTVQNRFCTDCPIGCIRITKSGDVMTEGPEYEPIWALGPRIGNGDLHFLIQLFEECLRVGVDPIGFGGVMAFAMECYQRGLLSNEYSLTWGEQQAIRRFLEELVEGNSTGGALRNGTREYYRLHPETRPYAMEVKGVELSGQEPRQSKAFGLSLGVSNWGADWGYGLPTIDVANNIAAAKTLFPDEYKDILEVTSEREKAKLVCFTEAYNAISDSLGICKFACPETYALMPSDLAKARSAELGFEQTAEDLLLIGEKIINLERSINQREGFTADDDYLPERFLKEPIVVDIYEGDRLTGLKKTPNKRVLTNDFDAMRQEYYNLRGWKDGMPTTDGLKQLQILEVEK